MTRAIPHFLAAWLFAAGCAVATSVARAEEPSPPALPNVITLSEYLVLPAVGQYGRLPIHQDGLEAQLVAGAWHVPAAGDTVESPSREPEAWRTAQADDRGVLATTSLRGGYALATVDSPTTRVMMLEAAGHAMAYVNGEPRAGDVYGLGWLRLPVLLQQGQNTLLFHLAAGKLVARLTAPSNGVFIAEVDHTLPTIVRGEAGALWAAVPVVNATSDWLDDARLECTSATGAAITTPIAPIPPLSVHKAPFQLRIAEDASEGSTNYELRLGRGSGSDTAEKESPLDTHTLTLRVVDPEDVQVRTFVSRIDRSIQPYAVRPATEAADAKRPGAVVALHAAAVSCEDHAARFTAKPWAHVIAPQGHRPHGFDWQAWARTDVLEALTDAERHYPIDARRTCLTGYSMGGHGAWHLGVTYPDRFAAVGPNSGWISLWSYGGGMPSSETPTEIDALLLRGYSASDTLALLPNLSNTGVYVMHGAADEKVPVAQARFMRTRLASFHPNFVYYEEAGGGHDWGDRSCDWPAMMDYFRQQTAAAPADVATVHFTTANPAVSSKCHWVSIEAQQEQLNPSHVAVRQDRDARTFVGNTANVARLALDVAHLSHDQPIDVTLDTQPLHWLPWPKETQKLWFERQGKEWSAAEAPSPQWKGPARNGTFNAVFDHDAVLVYGTGGSAEENCWAAAKARYDAETYYYRGGGALDVLPDNRFDLNAETDRNVVLYGNADTNGAWPLLLSTSPVEVRGGQVRVGTRSESGSDLAVMMVRPRPGSDSAMVGVVGGTGPVGMQLTNRLRWFVSGIVYPDLMVFGPRVLTEGTAEVRAWGYFGLDWQVDSGEISWRDATL